MQKYALPLQPSRCKGANSPILHGNVFHRDTGLIHLQFSIEKTAFSYSLIKFFRFLPISYGTKHFGRTFQEVRKRMDFKGFDFRFRQSIMTKLRLSVPIRYRFVLRGTEGEVGWNNPIPQPACPCNSFLQLACKFLKNGLQLCRRNSDLFSRQGKSNPFPKLLPQGGNHIPIGKVTPALPSIAS